MREETFVLRDDDMTKRLTVTLDDDLYEKLEEIAKEQERTVPNLLAYLGREEVKRHQAQQESSQKKESDA